MDEWCVDQTRTESWQQWPLCDQSSRIQTAASGVVMYGILRILMIAHKCLLCIHDMQSDKDEEGELISQGKWIQQWGGLIWSMDLFLSDIAPLCVKQCFYHSSKHNSDDGMQLQTHAWSGASSAFIFCLYIQVNHIKISVFYHFNSVGILSIYVCNPFI